MKGTEKIIAHIRADGEAKVDAIIAEAERKCEAVRQEYELKARDAYTEKIRNGVKQSQARLESMQRLSRMESKKGLLNEKQALVSESFERAVDKLVSLPEEDYRALLVKFAVEAAKSGDGELIFNAADREKFGDYVVKAANEKLGRRALSLSESVGSFKGGLMLHNGNIELNSTLELLVELCKGELSTAVAAELFA